jgi:simple sugar transport system permease protein
VVSGLREHVEKLVAFADVLVAVLVGFALSGLLIEAGGYSALKAFSSLFTYSFSDLYYISSTLSFATPLMLTALTFAVGVRAGVFNIGAEGQLYVGALGAVLVGALQLPAYAYLPLGLLLGIGFAVLLAAVAGILKARKGVNEVVSTIMLNWIAYWTVEYMRTYQIPDPHDPSKTVAVPPPARLPLLVRGTELSAGIIVAVAAVLGTYYLLWHTVLGYELRAAGLNPDAARYAGIRVERAMLASFIVGGIAAGLAGFLEVAGRPPHYAITTGLSNLFGLGFDGIAVSLIGLNHPLAMIPAAIFVGALKVGARGMQIEAGVPLEMVKAVQGIIIVSVAAPGLVRTIQMRRRVRRAAR